MNRFGSMYPNYEVFVNGDGGMPPAMKDAFPRRLEVVKDPFIPDFEIVEDPDMPCLEVLKDPGTPDLEQVDDPWYFDEWNYFREGFTWWTKEKDTGVWKPVHEKTKWWFDSWNYYGFGFRWWIKERGRWKPATESSTE